ncbi:DUF3846 domain-containing protein [Lawsonibacter sp. JLR.KK007]|uniref:DUF3846 domain-containing protein n=1 Tax=Lawsonibacter sp. JLR.KK007 TaxID=3114293 RepID=UPI002FF372C3
MPRKKRARVEKPPLHVVSLSGGKDSTAMLLLMVEQSMPIDMVVTADTGMEFPEMYRHWDQVEQYLLRKRGLKLTILRHPEGFERMMFDHPVNRAEEWQHVTPYGYGWPGIKKGRWCTGQLKTHLINKAVSQLRKTHKIFHYVGIAADEPERIKGEHYPLCDWGITEAQALQICYDRGFDWGGLYEIYHRCSCWCCPFQRIDELRKLRRHHPQLWAKLLDMDDRALAQFGHNALGRFKDHWTVAELEERFSAEDREISLFDSDKKKGADVMNVLVVEPGMAPYEKEINGLEEMQAVVGGPISALYPFKETTVLVVNDEGINLGLEFNRSIEGGYGGVFGTFFVCGLNEDKFCSLTPEQMEHYKQKYLKAEVLIALNGNKPFTFKVDPRPRIPPDTPKHPPKKPGR